MMDHTLLVVMLQEGRLCWHEGRRRRTLGGRSESPELSKPATQEEAHCECSGWFGEIMALVEGEGMP